MINTRERGSKDKIYIEIQIKAIFCKISMNNYLVMSHGLITLFQMIYQFFLTIHFSKNKSNFLAKKGN